MKISNTLFRSDFNIKLSALYSKEEIAVLWRRALSAVCQVGFSKTYFITSDDLTPKQRNGLKGIADRLAAGEPLEYILGFAEFCSLRFKVTTSTLIPRLETQELVALIKERYPSDSKLKIVDIGTGSGCIAISLAKAFPAAQVTALDISAEALAVAQENAAINSAGNVRFAQCDFLNADSTDYAIKSDGKFDIIVSNPPYVRPSEKVSMSHRVLDYEPHTAIFVPGYDPLIFYRRIREFAVAYLNPDGLVVVEINQWLSGETEALFTASGFKAHVLKDLFSNPRIVTARF